MKLPTNGSQAIVGKAAIALFLNPQSASLDWDYFTARLNSESLIEWWCRRWRKSGHPKLYVIIQSEKQRRSLAHVNLEDTVIFTTKFSGSTGALAELARKEGLDHIALVSIATALGPVELLGEMFAEHLALDRAVTWSSGLPALVEAWIFSRDLLEQLSALRFSWLPSHPGLAYRKLQSAAAAGVIPDQAIFSRSSVFDAAGRYGRQASDMPLAISLSTIEEIEIARELLRDTENPEGVEVLLRWKQELIKQTEERARPKRRASNGSGLPRVLYVSNASAYSGAEESLCQLVRKIDKRRFELFAAIGLPSRFHRELTAAGAQSFAFTDGFFEPTVKNLLAVRTLLDEVKPHLIHSNALDGMPFLWNAVDRGIPFIQHVRNGVMRPYQEYVEAASSVITISRFLRRGILRFAVSPDRVHVIYDEVDTEWFHPDSYNKYAMRERYGIRTDAKVVLMIARYAEYKRHDLMLDAFQEIRRRVPSAHLLLNGEVYREDKYYDGIKARIDQLNQDGTITQIPYVDDIRQLHALADVLVLCSDGEPLGRCIVEAMSMEIPAIVTDTGGSHEIIEDGITGMVIPGGNVAALAERVISCLEDPVFSRQLGRTARSAAQQRLTADQSAAQAMAIYESVL
jgi:glycosyltransferase involved in cell wall biosynthesis